ncbi:PA14 domain-containing protein [Streptomyces gibsoniae]|uniref:PA14 domain-containing protein n=1 Tax=Streptomyces gibsoniae TaxID=3075529 RepID=A0ABU2TW34_9ACTN|nr:PA14 domain-containing protein [Streptomyces sp. DSM 41699]MDT0465031.1 PA14 domain-containing protein [Streptomyces sp. DSM 41699]
MNPARRRVTAAATTTVVLATAGGLLTAAAPASAATSCTSPVFKRQFFANTGLTGAPRRTDCDSAVDQSWSGAPASGLPADRFGVRWTVTRDFGSGGPFAFSAGGTDGIRVYLDGVRKLNLWSDTRDSRSTNLNLTVPKGTHTLRIDYVNWTGKAAVKFTYAPRTSATVDKVRPLAPAGVTAAYDKATRKAKVSWARNKEMDLAGYRVYRRPKGATAWTRLTATTATTYTDAPPATGQVFSYEVRAYDGAGNESGGTAGFSVTTVDRTPPAAPFVEMDLCPGDQPFAAPELVTTLQNAADIARYEMQRLDAATRTWATVYAGTKGAICDTGYLADGSKVTYRGRARDAAGNWSAYSAATTFTTFDLTPPATAADARVEYRSGVPHLVWSPVDGAASYQVLQYDPATGGYLDALPQQGTTKGTDVVPRQLLPVAGTYRYAVRALDAKGNAAAPVEVTLSMADRPGAIPAFRTTATRFGEGVTIAWSSADPWTFDESPLHTYRIVRTDPATGESTVVDRCKPNSPYDEPLQAPSTYWTWADSDAPGYAGSTQINGSCRDVSGESETTYEYRVVTVDPYGHESGTGPVATQTTPDTRRPAAVENLTAEQLPLGVRLTWTPPADGDVTGYYVWQGTTDPDTGDTVWKKNCWTGSSLAPTEILCPTVPDGRAHVYRVAATDGSGLYDDRGPEFFHTAEVSVALPDTRPPGWSGTEVRQSQYPDLYFGCSESSGLGDCSLLAGYRVERWDPARDAWTVLASGPSADHGSHLDTTVHEDRLGLYYYRVVHTDASGAEKAVKNLAYGIWDSWL